MIHIALVFIPWLYYWHGQIVLPYTQLNLQALILSCLVAVVIIDLIRIKLGWVVFGQRRYERKRLSASAFGAIGLFLVLLWAPRLGINDAAIGLPIIITFSFLDPLLGELRAYKISLLGQIVLGYMFSFIIWLLSVFYLGTPMVFLFIMPQLAVLCELPKIKYLDDNLLLLVIPLAVSLLILMYS